MDLQFDVHVVSPSYWKVTFENAPINLIDLDTVEQLADLVTRIEQDPDLTVVVSERQPRLLHGAPRPSDGQRAAAMPPGPTGLPPISDNLLRLSRVPAVTISAINGRVRGAGSEFVLSTDIRFAGPNAILGQPEVGIGAAPGGNPMGRLAELMGRGRAMEIVLGGNDFPAQLAAEYGYVNRVLLEGELDDFVDTFARRIASFDKAAISGTKEFVDAATAIPASDYASSVAAFRRTAGLPETADRLRSLFARGFQQPQGIELDLGKRIAEKA